MKIELNQILVDGDGEPTEPTITIGKVLSDHLLVSDAKPVIKFWDWAMKLRQTGVLELDRSDLDMLAKYVENLNTLNLLAKYRILEALKPPANGK